MDKALWYKESIALAIDWEPQVRDHTTQEFGTKLGKTESVSFCFLLSLRLIHLNNRNP